MDSRKLTTQDLISRYQKIYSVLAPDSDSVAMTKQVWGQWEKSGLTRPDIEQIASNHKNHELGLFYDIVRAAENLHGQQLNISYMAFCLDRYNFYALTAEDGYIVLVDESFFQLLFFLVHILVIHSQGILRQDEIASVSELVRDVVKNNYFKRNQFDFSRAPSFYDLLGRDYQITEADGYLFHSLKIFILSHEIGHHVLGHTLGNVTCHFGWENGQEVEVDSRLFSSEFEADYFANQLLSKIYETSDGSIPYAQCHYRFDFSSLLIFDIFRLLDGLQNSKNIRNRHSTHPPTAQRRTALKNNFSISEDDPFYQALLKSLNFLRDVLVGLN